MGVGCAVLSVLHDPQGSSRLGCQVPFQPSSPWVCPSWETYLVQEGPSQICEVKREAVIIGSVEPAQESLVILWFYLLLKYTIIKGWKKKLRKAWKNLSRCQCRWATVLSVIFPPHHLPIDPFFHPSTLPKTVFKCPYMGVRPCFRKLVR